jgi:hypothetical protein
MADLFVITLAGGLPISGDGTVKTINAMMEDGGLATIGNTTDPANSATDATAVSVVGLLKQLSLTMQALKTDWPDALGDGGGLKVDGSGYPLPVTGQVTATVSPGSVVTSSFVSGTTAYVAHAVVGGVHQFIGVANSVPIGIVSTSLEIDRGSVITGETTYRLYLYNATPPSVFADGAVFDLPAGDRPMYLGYIDFPATAAIGTTTQYCEINNLNKIIKTASPNLYGYLVTIGPFTPTASNYKLTLGTHQV